MPRQPLTPPRKRTLNDLQPRSSLGRVVLRVALLIKALALAIINLGDGSGGA
ncbi:MAG: hypothetical protein AAGF10_01295 [Verrucomicrobiota bacterium]